MNLVDILSEEQLAVPVKDRASDSLLRIKQPENGIYYLPTTFLPIQRDLQEIVIQIFGDVLTEEVRLKRQKTSINNLLDNAGLQETASTVSSFSQVEKLNLFYEQLCLITRHPSLLVDHFMPKKLLLLEVNERLLCLSGKLKFFNRFIDALVESSDSDKPVDLLVVTQDVKELELVEGLIIGKLLHYNNLCADRLYEGKVASEKIRSERQAVKSGKTKRRRVELFRNNVTKKIFPVTLHLATSQKLYNNFTITNSTKFLLIFSFDSAINPKNPNIEFLRSNNLPNGHNFTLSLDSESLKTPILVPLPLYSVEHMNVHVPQPSVESELDLNPRSRSEALKKWKVDVLNALVTDRHRAFEINEKDFYLQLYGHKMVSFIDWLHKWDISPFPLTEPIQALSTNLVLSLNDSIILKSVKSGTVKYFDADFMNQPNEDEKDLKSEADLVNFENDLAVYDYRTYRLKLTHLVHKRISDIEGLTNKYRDEILPSIRLEESIKQVSIDKYEESIADSYKKLRKVNDDANINDKKLGRTEADLEVYQKKEEELNSKLVFLESKFEALSGEQNKHEELDREIETQQETLSKLDEELLNVKESYDKILSDSEKARLEYQSKSSEAAALSAKLVILNAETTALQQKINGPGISSLPALIQKDEIIYHEWILAKLKKENEFMSALYGKRLEKPIKERSTVLENTTTGSLSRPSNRISRASTPL